jgi:hypothetical protein
MNDPSKAGEVEAEEPSGDDAIQRAVARKLRSSWDAQAGRAKAAMRVERWLGPVIG